MTTTDATVSLFDEVADRVCHEAEARDFDLELMFCIAEISCPDARTTVVFHLSTAAVSVLLLEDRCGRHWLCDVEGGIARAVHTDEDPRQMVQTVIDWIGDAEFRRGDPVQH